MLYIVSQWAERPICSCHRVTVFTGVHIVAHYGGLGLVWSAVAFRAVWIAVTLCYTFVNCIVIILEFRILASCGLRRIALEFFVETVFLRCLVCKNQFLRCVVAKRLLVEVGASEDITPVGAFFNLDVVVRLLVNRVGLLFIAVNVSEVSDATDGRTSNATTITVIEMSCRSSFLRP